MLPEVTELRILQAVNVLRRRDVTDVVLLGNPNLIAAAAERAGVVPPNDGLEIIDPATSPFSDSFANE